MLAIMTIILTVISALFEIILVNKIPFLMHLAEQYPLVGLVISFSLSWFLGHVFAAGGLVVMLAGIGSTVLTAPIYWTKGKLAGFSWKKVTKLSWLKLPSFPIIKTLVARPITT